MGRIRTIKPDFFNSADIARLTPLARLFYAYLWCEADREGRLVWNLENFEMRFFPREQYDIESLANELTEKLIGLYEVDGQQYGEILSFKSHQVINNKEKESQIPPRVKDACKRDLGERKERKGKEGANESRKSPNKFDDIDLEHTDYFISLLKTINPNHKQPNVENWAKDFRLLRERDKRPIEEIKPMLQWVVNDSFWRSVILCPAKLRERWDQLKLQRMKSRAKPEDSFGDGAI